MIEGNLQNIKQRKYQLPYLKDYRSIRQGELSFIQSNRWAKKLIIAKSTNFNNNCNKIFAHIISGLQNLGFSSLKNPKKFALKLAELLLHYGTFNFGKDYISYYDLHLYGESEKKDEVFNRQTAILKASIVFMGYALGYCDRTPDFSGEDLLKWPADARIRQGIDDLFQQMIPVINSGALAVKASREFNLSELINLSLEIFVISTKHCGLFFRQRKSPFSQIPYGWLKTCWFLLIPL